MSSVCMSKCIDDARVPVRATYVNLYKWPESDAEFVKSISRSNLRQPSPAILHGRHPSVVDSISCRQMYLRSYPFSREAEADDDDRGNLSRRCVSFGCGGGDNGGGKNKKKKKKKKRCVMLRKAKEVSCDALLRFFHGLLSCSATVDVAVQKSRTN